MDRFSDLVRNHITELDRDYCEDLPSDQRAESEQASSIGRLVVAELIGCRLRITTQQFLEQLEQVWSKDRLEESFDEHYTRELLEQIPALAKRTTRLSLLLAQDLPSEGINVYLSEAARNYIFGFWGGCVALCRAALEAALKERLRERLGLELNYDLNELIRFSGGQKLLDAHAESGAREVQRAGNQALHPSSSPAPLNERTAFDTLSSLRGVLLHLYGG
ncbi:MAG TPA: hypothetical protein VK335_22655 [Bryobacteraceae bacterium]|nr:hypothetical protein [Bryobacteraceae bacterium]HZW91916.1 hypothetical protein [Candidatus Eremiobacteraceae bacterium]